MSADVPFGATSLDTGEFLLGSVAVTPVFFESDGSIDPNTQDWEGDEINRVLDKIQDSVDWWSDVLAAETDKHELNFVIDDQYAVSPVTTGYEPIDRDSGTFQRYVGDWLTSLGYGDAPSIERAVNQFNDDQRTRLGTDWAFTIFVVDSSDDEDGFFSGNGFAGAFAFPGGLFYVVPSERPVSTYAHELGHIFWARDQYPGASSYTDQRGYYNAQNLNAWDNPEPGFVQEDSIMGGVNVVPRAFDNFAVDEYAMAMVGWRDSDGDGIFDVLDVPLTLDAIGRYDESSGNFLVQGSAHVDTLANLNSAGTQSDITLARISELQYRLDDGVWQTALAPDATSVDFNLQIPITESFDRIEFRAIDTNTTNTSDVLVSNSHDYTFSGNGGGVAFLDANQNGVRDAGETWLEGVGVTLLQGDQSPLYSADVDASQLPDGELAAISGLTITAVGSTLDGRVGALESSTLAPNRVLQALHQGGSAWIDRWDADNKLRVESDTDVGRFEIDFIALDTGGYGVEEGSFARVEAFDRNGVPIERVTSQMVAAGESGQLVIEDTNGRIASIEIYGHAETEILVSGIRVGIDGSSVTDAGGAWAIDNLADGSYSADFQTTNVTIAFPLAQSIEVADGKTDVSVAAIRIDSPRYNGTLEGDVNNDGSVAPRDALLVINDISRLGARILTTDELSGHFIDVSNDGFITALDALRVINLLQQAEGEGEEAGSPHSAIFARIGTSPSNGAESGETGVDPVGVANALADSAGKPDVLQSDHASGSDSSLGAHDDFEETTEADREAALEQSLQDRIFARLRHFKQLFEGHFG